MTSPAMAAVTGGAWGLLGYAVLWGHTPLVVHRPFVLSAVGTVALLPVRLVLSAIRFAEERLAGASFDFSRNNGWIGLLSAVAGAAIALAAFLAARWAVRWIRRSRQPA